MSLELPALHGEDPLGFLAALGLLRLLDAAEPGQVRLSFSLATRCAVLHSPYENIEDVADALQRIITEIPDDGALPGVPGGFPLRPASPSRKAGKEKTSESDPMRVPREGFRTELIDKLAGFREALAWLPFIVTDMAVDKKGRGALSPHMAPSGKQNVWTFYCKSLEEVRRNPIYLKEALIRWRRVEGFTGEYFDHRVVSGAADNPTGRSNEAGVPGATWLATQALPLLRVTGDSTYVQGTLWHRHNRRMIMIWPLWEPPLDLHAVRALIEHPTLKPSTSNGTNERPVVRRDGLAPLGVLSVHGAERQPIEGRKSAGPLAPLIVLDHRPDA